MRALPTIRRRTRTDPPAAPPADDRRRALATLVAVAMLGSAAVAPVAARAQAFGLGQLAALLARTRAGEATFTEKRYVTLLERTLESSGRLAFEAPDTFIRETLKPRRERLAVVGNQLTMSQGSLQRSVALDSVPEAAIVVDALRGTLTGNQAALERRFNATVGGSAERWTLELIPREPLLREQVASVRLAGEQGLVREVRLQMPDGDRSVMTIVPAATTTTVPAGTTTTVPAAPRTTPPATSAGR